MPQGPDELHEKWGDDGAALEFLEKAGIVPSRGGMFSVARELTAEELSALDYLCLEWDYGWQTQILPAQ